MAASRWFIALVLLLGSCKEENTNRSDDPLVMHKTEEKKPTVSDEYLALEGHFHNVLLPVQQMKSSDADLYWFIVSWMGTNYNTPDWQDYGKEGWRTKAKRKGIDCSGFARIMQDQIFSKKVRGGSQGILNQYCERLDKNDLKKGDLLFFRAPKSKNDRIVHVGVYLEEGYFVHATSKKSASLGLGLNINNLAEENWTEEFVTGGRVK